MSKITLEDCASKYEGRKILAPQDWPRAAALIRAAQKVVAAARNWDEHAQWCPVIYEPTQTCTCWLHACLDAINAFRKLEEGE